MVGVLQSAFEGRFIESLPSDANSFALQAGSWKFDFEKATAADIIANAQMDGRPKFCSDTFPNFANLRVVELGPSDGYNTLGLELQGVTDLTSIEANSGAFLRCLILKNAMNLKAKYLLGDFLKYINEPSFNTDVIYASGVLYHLIDPVEFILRCGQVCDHLFLWSFFYDKDHIATLPFETECFKHDLCEQRAINGETFTYHRRFYRPEIVADPKYAGGLADFANWLDKDDLFKAVELAGFKIKKTYLDKHNNVHAYNLLCSK